jgi:hypothetical protein
VFWLLQAALVDAVASTLGRSGRRTLMLAVSAYTFPAWIAYALLGLAQAAALRWSGSDSALLGTLQWLTLPVLAWFVALSVLAIRAVYDIAALNAFAFALLPYAVVSTLIVVLTLLVTALHAGGVL